MAEDTIRLRDVVQVELEQLEQYGEAASDFFHELSGEIRGEFTATLEELLTRDLVAFQSQVNRSLTSNGLGEVSGLLGSGVGDMLGAFLPDSVFGDVFGAAISGALKTAAQDFARTGSFDIGRTVQAANRYGGNRLDNVMSQSQRSAEAWGELSRGQRNL
jgi:hypothetical protein